MNIFLNMLIVNYNRKKRKKKKKEEEKIKSDAHACTYFIEIMHEEIQYAN